MEAPAPSPAGGRSCDGCTMCCKLIGIAALDKPRGVRCPHCEPGVGCRIWGERPDECRGFHCGYLVNPRLGEEWKPSVARLIVAYRGSRDAISIHVDPARPDAWRREPYRSRILRWAANARAKRLEPVLLWRGPRPVVIEPEPTRRP